MKRSNTEQECLDIIRESIDNLTSQSALALIDANRNLTSTLTDTELTLYLTVLRGVSARPMESIQPGKAGTVTREGLSSAEMGDGAGKPSRVILDGILKMYVGIGWIDQRPARQFDADVYPVVVD